ncbi:homotrimeric ring hydroxylase [Actinocorallia herbida]|uniref:Homotrimeric ring hydroxylase n=1 Tax=Actinocorallia herbida TaxID=58109 RepID=A0A3N1D0S3_9ACTN|nr:Rieske 2Fe-2S domain-containing protein [Actinocorallia herbida]ROO87110.1 homotrimeric ring hydroxylase [Actinocorallia herbida]
MTEIADQPAQPEPAPAARRRPRRAAAPAPAARPADPAAAPGEGEPAGQDWSSWPTYNAATLGFRNYWYPVEWARRVGRKPMPITLLGEQIVLVREGDKVRALHDRCPHRGVPLSLGRREFDGTISCPYHGWTFDTESGKLCAVITDGPESPICGKVSVRTYPIEERLGLVWVYVGDGAPPPVERDIPSELLENPFVMGGRTDIRDGNWRFAAENGFDEGHAKYLHNTALWRLFKVMPAWNKTRVVESEKDGWLIRVQDEVHWEADFPGLGTWTNKRWWKRMPLPDAPGKAADINPVIKEMDLPGFVSIRLPGLLRVAYPHFIHYEWYVPVDADHVRYVQIMVRFEQGLKASVFKAKYVSFIRWLFHGQFTGQDAWMVDVMDAPPEKLYRPDLSVTAWRRLIERSGLKVQREKTGLER